MIYKMIKATVKPECKDEFIERQRIWNDVMSKQRGFLGVQIATASNEPNAVYVLIAMDSREDLERFMAGDHDTIMDETRMQALYEHLDIRILDAVEPGPPRIRLEVSPSRTASGYQIALLSEVYRASATLRAAVEGGVLDCITDGGISLFDLARDTDTTSQQIERLIEGLAVLNLVVLEGDRVHLSEIAKKHLRKNSAAYMGDLVLHNTRPLLWERWGNLSDEVGLTERHGAGGNGDHELFLNAMSSVARSGQAQALLAAIDLTECQRLLDVGGALGDYSVAFCRAHEDLECIVLDLPESKSAALRFIAEAGFSERIQVVSANYREELAVDDFDSALLSNVLRGESPDHARDLLKRIAASMKPGGLLIVQDLFVEEPRGHGPLLAAMFGLHLPAALNGTVDEVCRMIEAAGFGSLVVTPLDNYVVSNRAVTARRLGASV